MPISPTQLSLRHLRAEGWALVEVVEHWQPHAQIRKDLFGVIDIVALGTNETLAVQTTTAAHVADRIRKLADHPNIGAIREAGWQIRVHGWAKKSGRWTLTRDENVS